MIARVLACVLLPIVVLLVRSQVEAAVALAEASSRHVEPARQVEVLGQAARRFLPWGGASTLARQRLAELGRKGVPGAYETLRGSILAARWLVTPSPDLLDEANRALGAGAPEYLAPTPQPLLPYTILALVGLGAFIIGTLGATRGGDRRRGLPSVVALVGLVVMFVGLWRA